MTFERRGDFVSFRGEDGIRYLARFNAIQLICDVDEMATESYVIVAGRTILVREPFEEIREILTDEYGSASL